MGRGVRCCRIPRHFSQPDAYSSFRLDSPTGCWKPSFVGAGNRKAGRLHIEAASAHFVQEFAQHIAEAYRVLIFLNDAFRVECQGDVVFRAEARSVIFRNGHDSLSCGFFR